MFAHETLSTVGAAQRLRTRSDRAIRYIFGRDFFISYARRDGAAYAAALATELGTTHSCYLDQLASPRGAELPAPIRKEVSRATTFVLVGSQAAVESHYVGEEIRRFLESGRPILLLDVDSALASAPWNAAPWSQLVGVFRQPESADALCTGRPSEATVAYVRGSFAFTKHDRRLRRASLAAAGLLVAAIGGGALVSAVAAQRASDAGRRADSARADETKARTRADAESRRASEAGQRATAAQEQEAVARQRADEQQRIAMSRGLANESASRLDTDPELAIVLAAHSFDAAATLEARRALLSGLSRYPGLSRIVRAPTAILPGTFALSANGRVFATGDDRWVEVWDANPLRRRVRIAAPSGGPDALALTPDGATLALAGRDDVALIDGTTGREVGRLRAIRASALAFVDARRLAVAVNDEVNLWDTTDRSHPLAREKLLSLEDGVGAIAVDPSGRLMAAASMKQIVTCRLASCAATVEPLTRKEDLEWYLSLAFAPRSDVPVLAGVTLGGRLSIWELESRLRVVDLSMVGDLDLVAARSELSRDFYSVALGPGAAFVVVGSAEGRLMTAQLDALMTWSQMVQGGGKNPAMKDAESVLFPGRRPEVHKLAYAPGAPHVGITGDGHLILAQADGGLSLWDPSSSSTFEFSRAWMDDHERGGTIAVSADGQHVVDRGRGVIRLRDVANEGPPVTMSFPAAMALAVSPDASLVASVDAGGGSSSWRTLAMWDARGRARFRALVDRRVAPAVKARTYPTQLVVGGPTEGPVVGLVLGDGTVAAWSVEPKTVRLLGARAGATRIAVSPSGGEVAIAGRDGAVSLWDVRGGGLTRLPGSVSGITAIAYSNDGRALAAVTTRQDHSGAFIRWDLDSRGEPRIWSLSALSSSAKAVAIGDNLRELAVVHGSTVDVWDAEAQALVISRTLPSDIASVTFDRDGGLVVGHEDGVAYLDLNPAHLVSYVCGLTARRLTAEESQRYLGAASTPLHCGRHD